MTALHPKQREKKEKKKKVFYHVKLYTGNDKYISSVLKNIYNLRFSKYRKVHSSISNAGKHGKHWGGQREIFILYHILVFSKNKFSSC